MGAKIVCPKAGTAECKVKGVDECAHSIPHYRNDECLSSRCVGDGKKVKSLIVGGCRTMK